MKKIIHTWFEGCKVLLRFALFYIVLHIFSSIVGSLLMLIIPLVLLLPEDQVEKYKDLMFGVGLIFSMVIVAPFLFYYVSKLTGYLQGKPKVVSVKTSHENKEKGERLMKELKERREHFNKDTSSDAVPSSES